MQSLQVVLEDLDLTKEELELAETVYISLTKLAHFRSGRKESLTPLSRSILANAFKYVIGTATLLGRGDR